MNNDKRQERLVSLVRKLLELSRSNSNAHEAGLALSRAQRLMEKYGISELDATLSSVRDVASQNAPSEAEKVPEWMTRLAWAVMPLAVGLTSHGAIHHRATVDEP